MPKKPTARKIARKVTRRKRKSKIPIIDNGLVIEVDQVYRVVNKVQVTREPADFIVRKLDSLVVENILKDTQITFTKKEVVEPIGECVQYFIQPPPLRQIDKDFEDFEIFPDEIVEDGQIFP